MKTFLKTLTLSVGVSAVALLGLAFTAQAADFPSRPIKLAVSYPAGGATDFQARIVTMLASKYLGQPVVIVNKPGAGGQVGWNDYIAEGGTDGYDLAAYNLPHVIAQSIMFDTKYNIHNMVPLVNWGADPAVLIVPKDSPFNSTKDLVAYAKSHPGKVTVSGAGLYVGHHIATLQLERAADVNLKYIPAGGGVPAMKMVIGDVVKAGFNNLSDAYRNRSRIKILAVADVHRNKEFLPNVPTLKEQGYDVDDSSVNFRGIMAKKGVPEARLELLAEKLKKMFEDPKIQAKMKAGGSPMYVVGREKAQQMFQHRQDYLKKLLGKLKAEQKH